MVLVVELEVLEEVAEHLRGAADFPVGEDVLVGLHLGIIFIIRKNFGVFIINKCSRKIGEEYYGGMK